MSALDPRGEALVRVYDDGEPLETDDHFFAMSPEGVEEGDLVFVVGNPGSTDRLVPVAELLFYRDVRVPALLEFVGSRAEALEAYVDETGDEARSGPIFSLLNAQKAYRGRADALRDPIIMARRRDAEERFRAAVQADPELREEYGPVFEEMEAVQAGSDPVAAQRLPRLRIHPGRQPQLR